MWQAACAVAVAQSSRKRHGSSRSAAIALKPCTAVVTEVLLGAVFVSEMWIAGDQSAPRGLSNVPWVRRGRGSQREARAAAWEAVCEK